MCNRSESVNTGSNSYKKVKAFKCLSSFLSNQNSVYEELKCILKIENLLFNMLY